MIKYSVKGGDKVESLKINYIMYSTGRTGGSRGLMNLMNELVKLGHEISITVLHYDSWFPLSPDIRIITKKTKLDLYYFYGVQKISKRNTILRHIFFINKLMSIVPRVDVNAATFSPTAYIASWKSMDGSTPFYHMQHFETIFFGDPVMKKFVYDSYFLPIYKIANSIWLREKLFEITGTRYPIVNTAVEHDIFYKRDTNGIKKNEDGNRIDIVALGKGGWKKATSIYKAVSKVRALEKDREIVLHYFGHNPPKDIPVDGKRTVFLKDPSDDELATLYSNSDIQITFSDAESFPLPPLEAMACGCSVITTPFGTEDYAVDGETALVVEPGNTDMLAEKIRILIEDDALRNKLKERGIKTASRFNYPSQGKILEGEIKKAMGENATRDWKSKLI